MVNEIVQKFPLASYTGLSADLIAEDIRNFIRENPEYNQNWEDFLSSTPANLLINLFSQIANLVASRTDFITNEGFTGLATQDVAKFRLLKLLNYKLSTTVAAEVPVIVTVTGGDLNLLDYTLTFGFKNETETTPLLNFSPKSFIVTDATGNTKNFEIISYDKENDKYNYFEDVKLNPLTISDDNIFRVSAFEGTSVWEDFYVQGENFAEFTLSRNPVIKNSVVVYKTENLSGNIVGNELVQVDSFLEPRAQNSISNGVELPIPYVREVNIDGTTKIVFGNANNLDSARRLKRGDTIRVFYRVGGGVAGNVTIGSINLNEAISTINGNYALSYFNDEQGSKGSDQETLDEAVFRAPRQIRTAGRLVTVEDYNTILNTNPNVIKSKTYGQTNLPADFADRFGFFPNPMDVWNFVLMKKPNWQSLKPSQYGSFEWLTTNLQNHFNGEYYFRRGQLGVQFTPDTNIRLDSINELNFGFNNTRRLRNYFVYDTPAEFKNNIFILPDGYAGEPITSDLFNEQLKLSFSNVNLLTTTGAVKRVEYNNDNYQILPDASKKLLTSVEFNDNTSLQITEDINAEFRIPVTINLTGFDKFLDNTTTQQNIKIRLDNLASAVEVNLWSLYNNGSDKLLVNSSNAGFYWDRTDANPANQKGLVQVLNYLFDDLYSGTYPFYEFDYNISSPTSFVAEIENQDDTDFGVQIEFDEDGDTNYENYTFTFNTRKDQRWFLVVEQLNELIQTEIDLAGKVYFSIEETAPNTWKLRLRSNILGSGVRADDTSLTINTVDNLFVELGTTGVQDSSPLDYSNVCSIETIGSQKYFVMTSPMKGVNSRISFEPVLNQGYTRVFNFSFGNSTLFCFGQRRLTVSLAGSPVLSNGEYLFNLSPTFGRVYYEAGAFNAIQPQVFLNYIYTDTDRIYIGDHLINTRGIAARLIYSTILTERDVGGVQKITADTTLSSPIVKVTQNPIDAPAIYSIDGLDLQEATPPEVNFDVSGLSPLGATYTYNFKMQIDEGIEREWTIEETTSGFSPSMSVDDFFAAFVAYINTDLEGDVYPGTTTHTVATYNAIDSILKFTTLDDTVYGKIKFIKSQSNDLLEFILGTTEYVNFFATSNENVTYVGGDYKLEWVDEDENTSYQYKFTITNNPNSLISDGVNYFHFVEDNRLIRRVASQRGDDLNQTSDLYDEYFAKYKIATDEDELNAFLEPFRIVGIQNQFKQPIITPFTIIADVYVSKQIGRNQIKPRLEEALYNKYSLLNVEIGTSISKSEIMTEMIRVNGVLYADIKYIGVDPKTEYIEPSFENVSVEVKTREFIDCTFDEILVLSDVVNELSRPVAGLIISYKEVEGK